MAELAYCGIDVGTQGVRAAVVAADGRVLAGGQAALPASLRHAGRHEQDPQDWWRALCVAVRAAMADAHGVAAVEAVALDATSGTVVVEAPDGRPIGPALMYDDARATDQAQVAARVGATLWHELGYAMQPTWALPKVMWLVANGLLPVGARVAHQSDHLVRRLTDTVVASDTSNALKTGADIRSARWPRELFAELGVPADALPELVLPGSVLGTVADGAATATGLPRGIPVRAGMTDGCAAQIASGALAPGSWSSALGTTLVVKGSTDQLVHDPAGAVYCHRHPDGGWLPGGASSSGAGIIATQFAGRDLDELTDAAARLVPVAGVSYPLIDTGERFPFVAPRAHGVISPQANSDAARFASLCQSIGYVERLAYDVLRTLGADTSGPVALTGGAVRNTWWNQLRTDILGRPTVVPSSAQAAVGMAVLAAAQPGSLTATAAEMVRYTKRYEPDAGRHTALTAGYNEFVDDLANRGWLDHDVAHRVRSKTAAHQ